MSGPLPQGWEEKFTPEGRPYYVNHATKTTHWERPAPVALSAYGGGYSSSPAGYPPGPPSSQDRGNAYPPQPPYGGSYPPPAPPQQQSYGGYPPAPPLQQYAGQSAYSSPQQQSYGGSSYPQQQPPYGVGANPYQQQQHPAPPQLYGTPPPPGQDRGQYYPPQQPQYGQQPQGQAYGGAPAPPPIPAKKPTASGISPGMKMAGAAVAGVAGGLAIGSIIHHEQEQNDRIERLEDQQARAPDNYGGYQQPYSQPPPPPSVEQPLALTDGGGYGYTNTTVINEDGHWWQADKQTVIQTDSYGNQNVTQTSDGWFKNETTVTETDPYGNTTVEEETDWF